jgi:hypothetical protein
MRISERKTTAAVLRFILGEKLDDDFCKLVGCSRDLWRKLENRDRRMTERTAAQVEAVTGASRLWLLAGKAKAKPVAVDGNPFTLEWFRAYRAKQLTGERKPLAFAVYPAGHLVSIIGSAVAAGRGGKLAAFAVELEAVVAGLRNKFGFDAQAGAAALETIQAEPKPYLLEVSDNGKESAQARAARLEFLRKQVVTGGAFPTSATARAADDGSTKLTITGAAHPTKPLKIQPRSRGRKAKP